MTTEFGEYVLEAARKDPEYARAQLARWRRAKTDCPVPECGACRELDRVIAELGKFAARVVDPTVERYP